MANYYTKFSFLLPLQSPEAIAYALALHQLMRSHQMGEDVDESKIPEELRAEEIRENWYFQTEADANEPNTLWFTDDAGSGGIGAVCQFVSHLLGKFTPSEYLEFQWSNDCDEPHLDAFGGGAARITKDEINTFNTRQWLQEQQQRAAGVPPAPVS